jgi:dolichol-phosphate mannosyltransferase
MADTQTLESIDESQLVAPEQQSAQQKVWIALPAYNEEKSLPPLLEAIHAALEPVGIDYGVIVVDDGSRDATASIAREAAAEGPVELIMHVKNQGLAAAIRTGLGAAVARSGPNDVIVTMDCDDTHPPRLIPQMLDAINDGRDVVIASRFQPGAKVVGVPASRMVYSIGAKWMFQTLFPIHGVRDYTCGYRAYRAEALQQAYGQYGDTLVDQDGFQCMVDILLKLRKLPLIFGEVPLILRYDLKRGQSKMRMMKTSLNTLGLLWRRKTGTNG